MADFPERRHIKPGCFVYVIEAHLKGCPAGYSKIGIANDPSARLEQLRTGNPFSIRLHHTYPCPDRTAALDVEDTFHRLWRRQFQTAGEWFSFTGSRAHSLMCLTASFYFWELYI